MPRRIISDTEDSGSNNSDENEAPGLTMPHEDATAEELRDVSEVVNCSF